MVICALKQTNSRSLAAAVDYISKMSYQDLGRDQMGAAVSRTANTAIKASGGCRSHVYLLLSSYSIFGIDHFYSY